MTAVHSRALKLRLNRSRELKSIYYYSVCLSTLKFPWQWDNQKKREQRKHCLLICLLSCILQRVPT